ncbi:hypothetical protein Tco_1445613 [Tanacetum coccineum]|uniref:Uncharacterized protein n=1 Tax=Tanacetum coccineum TaxID=301880 RepID=A0ABQ5HWD1_9ASTR
MKKMRAEAEEMNKNKGKKNKNKVYEANDNEEDDVTKLIRMGKLIGMDFTDCEQGFRDRLAAEGITVSFICLCFDEITLFEWSHGKVYN